MSAVDRLLRSRLTPISFVKISMCTWEGEPARVPIPRFLQPHGNRLSQHSGQNGISYCRECISTSEVCELTL